MGGVKPSPIVTCEGTTIINFGASAVATGCSMGVDSFSVIKRYLFDNEDLPSYKITHFACFNVGAFGTYNTDVTRESFLKAVAKIKDFGEKFKIPVVSVDSNIHEFYPELDFNWSHAFLNMSCTLALQKLWGKYLYASGYSLEHLSLNLGDTAYYEPYLLPQLSTESTEIVPVDSNMSRSNKVRYIMSEPIVQDNLNVCLKEQFSNNGTSKYDDKGKLNCGHCEKCKRTMLQLDAFGKLSDFEGIFNLTDWNQVRPQYLKEVYFGQNHNNLYSDILSTIPEDFANITKLKRQYFVYINKQRFKAIIKKIIHPLR